MQTDTKNSLVYNMAKDSLITYYWAYITLLTSISLFEAYMIVYRLLTGFAKPSHVSYFISYLVLFAVSVFTLTMLLINRKKGTFYRFLTVFLDFYGAFIILWSAAVSYLDICGGSTLIVYLTVIMCVAAIMNVRPYIYAALVLPLTVAFMFLSKTYGAPNIQGAGYRFNLLVFTVFALLLTFFLDNLKTKGYIAKRDLEKLSYYDQLTGVYNRHSLRMHISRLSPASVFYFGILDVDNFKSVNDTYGHDVGDKCLSDIAELLTERFGEKIYRYGGDEFVIITDCREEDILHGFDSINDLLEQKHPDQNVHVSAGFYCPTSSKEEYADYFKKADYALYEAKRTGKRRVIFYKESDVTEVCLPQNRTENERMS